MRVDVNNLGLILKEMWIFSRMSKIHLTKWDEIIKQLNDIGVSFHINFILYVYKT